MFARLDRQAPTWSAPQTSMIRPRGVVVVHADARDRSGRSAPADDVVAIRLGESPPGRPVFRLVSSDGGATFAAARSRVIRHRRAVATAASVPQIRSGRRRRARRGYQTLRTRAPRPARVRRHLDRHRGDRDVHRAPAGAGGAAICPSHRRRRVAGKPAAGDRVDDFRAAPSQRRRRLRRVSALTGLAPLDSFRRPQGVRHGHRTYVLASSPTPSPRM